MLAVALQLDGSHASEVLPLAHLIKPDHLFDDLGGRGDDDLVKMVVGDQLVDAGQRDHRLTGARGRDKDRVVVVIEPRDRVVLFRCQGSRRRRGF